MIGPASLTPISATSFDICISVLTLITMQYYTDATQTLIVFIFNLTYRWSVYQYFNWHLLDRTQSHHRVVAVLVGRPNRAHLFKRFKCSLRVAPCSDSKDYAHDTRGLP